MTCRLRFQMFKLRAVSALSAPFAGCLRYGQGVAFARVQGRFIARPYRNVRVKGVVLASRGDRTSTLSQGGELFRPIARLRRDQEDMSVIFPSCRILRGFAICFDRGGGVFVFRWYATLGVLYCVGRRPIANDLFPRRDGLLFVASMTRFVVRGGDLCVFERRRSR